jgi:RNA polymerase sigma factor (sigma-70 family)
MKESHDRFLAAYDAYAASILRHASFRVRDQKTAEDITSETFMKAWDFVRKNNEVENFKGFLYKIADNLIIDHYRAKGNANVPIDAVPEARLADQSDLPAEMGRKLSAETIHRHLQSLPEDQRVILIYRYIDDLEIGKIRELTGKSATNIYVTIHRALKVLRGKMKETGR